jgi:SAM-dependent methyltransferase
MLSNPTWTKHRNKIFRSSDATGDFEEVGREMLADLKAAYHGCIGEKSIHVVGDSRRLPISTGAIDVIITSPPYLTRIDYAVAAAPELFLMNPVESLRAIRLNTMGSPVIRRSPAVQKAIWGEKCNRFLSDVAAHESKAAKSYYLKHMLQYFDDMEKSLSEIHRVLRPKGKALVVVQGSYFKEILCPLAELYVEMADGMGLQAEIVFNERVSSHMAHLNKRSSKYQAHKVYSEDFVLLTKR